MWFIIKSDITGVVKIVDDFESENAALDAYDDTYREKALDTKKYNYAVKSEENVESSLIDMYFNT